MPTDGSRRAFLKHSAALGIAGAATPFLVNLAALGEAAAAVNSDYKALVCVFLNGGNDHANTVTPYDQASYSAHASFRSGIVHSRDELTATLLNPAAALPGGLQYALAPNLAPLVPLFNADRLAVVLNVGTLMEPTTKAQYDANSVALPPKLFSHNDQQSFWQASTPEGAMSGWGGRIGDLFASGNGSATLTCINAAGNAVFLAGRSAVQYAISPSGPIPLNQGSLFGSTAAREALRGLITAPRTHLLENEHSRIVKRSLDTYAQVSSALAAVPPLATVFPAGNFLASQLKMVARLISASSELGARRQVFFVSVGGFDFHARLLEDHPPLMAEVAAALKAFYDATVELGAAHKVTTFTASDFGRSQTANGSGTDHGWGGHHFALGGAVRGRRFYGAPPVIDDSGPDDVGQGRLLPGVSVDQYAATLASWFGVAGGDMPTVLPNIGSYNTSSWNLGFL